MLYVKVKVSGKRSVFKAESYKANKNDLYGYRQVLTLQGRQWSIPQHQSPALSTGVVMSCKTEFYLKIHILQ